MTDTCIAVGAVLNGAQHYHASDDGSLVPTHRWDAWCDRASNHEIRVAVGLVVLLTDAVNGEPEAQALVRAIVERA